MFLAEYTGGCAYDLKFLVEQIKWKVWST
jgi:hypothetical protein